MRCGATPDAVLAIGTRLMIQQREWGIDAGLPVVRHRRRAARDGALPAPEVALVGDAAPVLKSLIGALERVKPRPPRARAEAQCGPRGGGGASRQARAAARLPAGDPRRAARDGILVDEGTQLGFVARLAFPVYRPRTLPLAGLPGQPRLGLRHRARRAGRAARRAGGSDHRRRRLPLTANELATAVRHRIPLTTVLFARRRLRQRAAHPARALRRPPHPTASPTRTFLPLRREASAHQALRAKRSHRAATCLARGRSVARRSHGHHRPVGELPSPWEFIFAGRARG